MALAKQFDFRVTGRGVLTDPTLPATPTNMVFNVDTITIDGVEWKAASIDSTSITNIQTNVETAVQKAMRTVQTVTLTSCTIADTKTFKMTAGDLSVTYLNSSGSSVTEATHALADAVKAAADANAAWAARFDTSVSGNNLVITQKGNHTKAPLIVCSGTGTLTTVTVTV